MRITHLASFALASSLLLAAPHPQLWLSRQAPRRRRLKTRRKAQTVSGELMRVDSEKKTLAVKLADGAEWTFDYTATTEITGDKKGEQGLATSARLEGRRPLHIGRRQEDGNQDRDSAGREVGLLQVCRSSIAGGPISTPDAGEAVGDFFLAPVHSSRSTQPTSAALSSRVIATQVYVSTAPEPDLRRLELLAREMLLDTREAS